MNILYEITYGFTLAQLSQINHVTEEVSVLNKQTYCYVLVADLLQIGAFVDPVTLIWNPSSP